MYNAELINRFQFSDSIEYDCIITDDEGVMPERRDHISIPADRDNARYLRSIKNSRCSYWEEQYFAELPVEELDQLPPLE